jgi:hypothetical protein
LVAAEHRRWQQSIVAIRFLAARLCPGTAAKEEACDAAEPQRSRGRAIAGLGINRVILGLPFGRPARAARRRRAGRPARAPVPVIAGRGLAAAITLLLVLLAAIGA